ncbi:hypothetical protein PTSG_00021 [Salpingoeca rosetta]|uniref:RNA helicase n=1 Tax=Salpingoeca rosetta (strain ATCC 50818 / BSB-021) TaxID=946362 RepID=F2TVA9_SALR5|nr:uncharacterized protein PTSG_00021 [Salpingoeca rosetta]EGD72005.1 hypothetical protein PTSG_00021 [Salpingoeca rosetta]|eukprot:XP_004998577.1 hypothetical protein PTSG_00021 [Salpingoeca rosetta]
MMMGRLIQRGAAATAVAITTTRAAHSAASFAVRPALLDAVKQLGFTKPTPIQSTVADALSSNTMRKPLIVGAQTGSGKTLAYVLPMLDELLQAPGRGCGLVVTPGKELCMQVTQVCYAVASKVGMKTVQMYSYDTLDQLNNPDVIVTTDTVLKTVDLSTLADRLCYLVIDEFDAAFTGTETTHLWSLIRQVAPGALKLSYLKRQRAIKLGLDPSEEEEHAVRPQVIFTGATLPDRGTKSTMAEVCSRLAPHIIVSTPKLHTPVDRLVQLFDFTCVTQEPSPAPRPIVNTTPLVTAVSRALDEGWKERQQHQHQQEAECSVDDGTSCKHARVCEYVSAALQQDASVLVFNNTVNSAIALSETLNARFGDAVRPLHKKIPPRQRSATLEAFKQGDVKVLCCTDLLARGIDLNVDLILQADFAQDVVSYLHRIGRTARNGKHGCAVSVVCDERLPLAKEIAAQLDSRRAQQWHSWRVAEAGTATEHDTSPEQDGADAGTAQRTTESSDVGISGVSGVGAATLSSLFSRNRSGRKRRQREQRSGGGVTKKGNKQRRRG